jgi:hypothetical protein
LARFSTGIANLELGRAVQWVPALPRSLSRDDGSAKEKTRRIAPAGFRFERKDLKGPRAAGVLTNADSAAPASFP